MHVFARIAVSALAGLCLIPLVMGSRARTGAAAANQGQRAAAKAQPRPHGQRVRVDPALVVVEDGDTVVIRWPGAEAEIVRILGIDTPETRRLEHNLPFDQPFGKEAHAFAQGHSPPRARSSCCGARPSTPTIEPSAICSSTAATSRSW